MPTLEFAEDVPQEMFVAHLHGKMLFHDAADKEAAYFARQWLLLDGRMSGLGRDEPVTLPAWLVSVLLHGPGLAELEAARQSSMRDGFTAGYVLLTLFMVDSLGLPLSLSRAIRVLQRAQDSEQSNVHGVALHCNRPAVLEAWRRMEPVAHLYAAHAVVSAVVERAGITSPDPESLKTLVLRVAAAYLEWAAGRVIHYPRPVGKRPLVDRGRAYELPERFPPVTLSPTDRTALAPWMRNAIELYRNDS